MFLSCSTVKCFKWRLTSGGDVQLTNRDDVPTENLAVSTSESVTFRSPGFDIINKKNNMFCVYNISIVGCNHITVRSTSGNHQLFDDRKDYLHFDFGDITKTVKGDSVGSFSESVSSSSFYAVLWSDGKKSTSARNYELETLCNEIISYEENTIPGSETEGSKSTLIFKTLNYTTIAV